MGNGLLSLLGFNGERPDPVTGHYLLGNGDRAFNPVLMRFNSPDSLNPFGKGGLNAYAYCVGDPVNRVDPTGHAGLFNRIFQWGRTPRNSPVNQSNTAVTRYESNIGSSGISQRPGISINPDLATAGTSRAGHPQLSSTNRSLPTYEDVLYLPTYAEDDAYQRISFTLKKLHESADEIPINHQLSTIQKVQLQRQLKAIEKYTKVQKDLLLPEKSRATTLNVENIRKLPLTDNEIP